MPSGRQGPSSRPRWPGGWHEARPDHPWELATSWLAGGWLDAWQRGPAAVAAHWGYRRRGLWELARRRGHRPPHGGVDPRGHGARPTRADLAVAGPDGLWAGRLVHPGLGRPDPGAVAVPAPDPLPQEPRPAAAAVPVAGGRRPHRRRTRVPVVLAGAGHGAAAGDRVPLDPASLAAASL